MRGAELSSPSVAYWHLQKLENLGLIKKDSNGEYTVIERTSFKGYVWIGRNLVPRLVFYSFFLVGLLTIGLTIVAVLFMARKPIEPELVLLTFVTSASSALFMVEGAVLLRRQKAKSL